MATQAFTPAQLASNIAFQTAKKAKPSVSTTPAPLQSLLNPKPQQSQAPSTMQTQSLPKQLPETGAKQSLSQFGDTIKAKYPQYANVDSTELGKKMLEKYPQYADKVEVAGVAEDIAGGVVKSGLDSALAEPGQAAIKFLGEKVTKPLVGLLPESGFKQKLLKNVEENIQGAQKPQETLVPGADKESSYYKGGKLLGDIAQTMLLPGTKVKKGVGLLRGALQLGIQGGTETAKYIALAEKRLPTLKELAIGVGGNIGIAGAIKGLGLVGKYLSPKLLKSAEKSVSEAIEPTGRKSKQLVERITPTFLQKGIIGSKNAMQELAKEGAEKFGSLIDDAVEAGALDDVKIPRQTIDDVLTLAKESTMVNGKIVNTTQHKVISDLQDVISQFDQELGGKEARAIKSILDKVVYATKGGIGAEDLSYKNTLYKDVADTLREELSKASPDLAKLNKEFSFYKTLYDVVTQTITRKQPQQGGLARFAAGIVGGQQSGFFDKLAAYVGTKLFLNATSSALRNTVSAQLKNKLANALAKGSSIEINAAVNAINKQNPTLALPYYKEGLVFGTPKASIGPSNPTVKIPPIIRETGFAKQPGTAKSTITVPKKEVVPVKDNSFNRMMELDTDPNYQKVGPVEPLSRAKQYETQYGPIQSVFFDGKTQKVMVNGKQYGRGDVSIFEKLDGDTIKANNASNKTYELRKQLQAIASGKGNKVSGSQLKAILDDLGIESVNDIPDESLQTILDLSRKQKLSVVTPQTIKNNALKQKGNGAKPKVGLGKETLEQDNLHKVVESTPDSILKQRKGIVKDIPVKDLLDFQDRGNRQIVDHDIVNSLKKGYDRKQPIDFRIFEDGSATVADGNGRMLAAKELGMETIPVRITKVNLDPKFFTTKQFFTTKPIPLQTIKNNALKQKGNGAKPKVGLGKEMLEQNVDDSLIQEARKYKSAEEFIDSKLSKQYRQVHQIDNRTSRPLPDIEPANIDKFVSDFKEQYGYPALKSKEVDRLKKIMQDPNAEIVVYRASPLKQLNGGDWVTIDKDYANDIKRQNGGMVYKYIVKAKDLRYPSTINGFRDLPSLNKWSSFQYQDTNKVSRLKQIRDQANKKPLPLKKK